VCDVTTGFLCVLELHYKSISTVIRVTNAGFESVKLTLFAVSRFVVSVITSLIHSIMFIDRRAGVT